MPLNGFFFVSHISFYCVPCVLRVCSRTFHVCCVCVTHILCVCSAYVTYTLHVCYAYVTRMLLIALCVLLIVLCADPPSHAGLDDVGVDLRHPVDGVGAHDAEVGHVHTLPPFLLDEGHPPQPVHVLREQGRHALETGREGGRERETM